MARFTPVLLAAAVLSDTASAQDPRFESPPRGLSVTVNENFYGITASTAGELAVAINEYGPEVAGERVAGATEQHVTWSYELARREDQCRIRSVEVNLVVTVTLPEWVNSRRGRRRLVAQWEAFAAAVRVHEEEHKRLNLEGAIDILDKIKALTPRRCPDMERVIAEVAERSLDRYADRQARYDHATRGGETQGVMWPPES